MKREILIADNDTRFRTVCAALIGNEEFIVHHAATPADTRAILVQGGIDVAVIDVRLVDDNDENDRSGIIIAKDPLFSHIPKLILTAYNVDTTDASQLLGIDKGRIPGVTAILKILRSAAGYWFIPGGTANRVEMG